jgi:hypothetical protein
MLRLIVSMLVVLFTSVPAWAVPVTEGFIRTSVGEDFSALYSMTGPDLSLHCTGIRLCGDLDPRSVGGHGPPGTPVSLDSRWFIDVSSLPQVTNLVLNGTAYRAQGTLDMTVGQVLRAPTVTAPFTLAGTLNLLQPGTLVDVGDLTLTGRGTVTAQFGTEVGVLQSIRFDFLNGSGPGTAPIPEPTTVLLLASGLAGLGLWRRRMKKEALS